MHGLSIPLFMLYTCISYWAMLFISYSSIKSSNSQSITIVGPLSQRSLNIYNFSFLELCGVPSAELNLLRCMYDDFDFLLTDMPYSFNIYFFSFAFFFWSTYFSNLFCCLSYFFMAFLLIFYSPGCCSVLASFT